MRYGLTKSLALDIMDVCILRKSSGANCLDCKYNGKQCVNMHRFAQDAITVMNMRLIDNCKEEGEDID
jgi:hypothetical protein